MNINNMQDCIKLYDIYFDEITKICEKYKENVYLFKYEDFLLNPMNILIEIFDFCIF